METTTSNIYTHASLEETQLSTVSSLLASFSSRSAQDLLALLADKFAYHESAPAACRDRPPPLDKGAYVHRAGTLFARFDDMRVTPRVVYYKNEMHDTVAVYAEMAGLLKEGEAFDGSRTWDADWSMLVRLSEDGRKVVRIQNFSGVANMKGTR